MITWRPREKSVEILRAVATSTGGGGGGSDRCSYTKGSKVGLLMNVGEQGWSRTPGTVSGRLGKGMAL